MPLALLHWAPPTPWQWAGFMLCGALGSLSHYCLTRSFRVADISATQSTKFLELLWAALLRLVGLRRRAEPEHARRRRGDLRRDAVDRAARVAGPWEGEERNMWKPTQQEALWFHGGNLHQSRHYSQFLSLQIKARFEGLPTPVYGLQEVHHLG